MKKFLIIAGEASGDVYGANFVRALKAEVPDVSFKGIGGPLMRNEGVEVVEKAENLSVIGITEVFEKIRIITSAYQKIKNLLRQEKCDGVILIDFPDFNFRVGKFAKGLGLRVFYFVIPQVWAWRKYRIRTMKKFIHKCVPIIPFEIEILRQAGIDAEYAGHPLLDVSVPDASPETIRNRLNVPENSQVVALFPGSRLREVNVHLPVMLESADRISRNFRNCFFLISCAPTVNRDLIESLAKRYSFNYKITDEKSANILSVSHSGIAVSGTIAVEGAIAGKPLVVIYKLNTVSYYLVKPFVRIQYISLPNLILNKRIYPELVQSDVTPPKISEAYMEITSKEQYNNIILDLERVRHQLGEAGVFKRVINIFIKSMVEN